MRVQEEKTRLSVPDHVIETPLVLDIESLFVNAMNGRVLFERHHKLRVRMQYLRPHDYHVNLVWTGNASAATPSLLTSSYILFHCFPSLHLLNGIYPLVAT